ncbi:major facilitator superfamily MFS_1 [Aciduliprofundum boonei T469]|uniref:Major facilitator superfamily MFS_1 n=2 Tax=Candidatus Aciduliprofundum boonei TaxID=379547 RepID=D3TD07_ACIB4|nr:major facilitator superfamily MFS_1 [Aciduliprofundum boonei T469]HII55485.1 MFS transporter [Candidatus Aciduliprofundum boonei]
MFYKFAAYGFLKNLRLFEPFILLFFKAAGLSYTEIGILYAIKEVSIYVLEIPTGVYADAFGRRRSMLMSMVSYIIAFFIFFSFSSFWLFAVAMVLYALGDAYRTGTHKAMILEYLKIRNISHKKVEYYGATRSYSQLGSATNALLAGFVVFYTGNYRDIFIITILPYIFNFINLATYPKMLDGEIRKSAGKIREQFKRTLADFRLMFKDKIVLKAVVNSSLFSASHEATKDYLQAVLQTFALSLPILLFLSGDKRTAVVVGIVYFFIYLMTAYASRNSYKIVKRVGNLGRAINATLVLGALIIILAGVFYHINWLIISIVLFLLIYVLHNIRRPMNVGYIADRIKSRVMASGLSVESQIKTFIAAGLSILMGYLADALGVGMALTLIGFIVLISAPPFFVKE